MMEHLNMQSMDKVAANVRANWSMPLILIC